MAKVSISANLTHSNCVRMAQTLGQHWQTDLTGLGSTGDFMIGHGNDGGCKDVHAAPYKGSFWIWTDGRGCSVFLSLRQGNPRDYAGAGRVPAGAYRGSGHCGCRSGH